MLVYIEIKRSNYGVKRVSTHHNVSIHFGVTTASSCVRVLVCVLVWRTRQQRKRENGIFGIDYNDYDYFAICLFSVIHAHIFTLMRPIRRMQQHQPTTHTHTHARTSSYIVDSLKHQQNWTNFFFSSVLVFCSRWKEALTALNSECVLFVQRNKYYGFDLNENPNSKWKKRRKNKNIDDRYGASNKTTNKQFNRLLHSEYWALRTEPKRKKKKKKNWATKRERNKNTKTKKVPKLCKLKKEKNKTNPNRIEKELN